MEADSKWIRYCIALSRECVGRGDHPFGAVFVHAGQVLLEGRNSVLTDWDPTAHGEMNLLRQAGGVLNPSQLAQGTLYSSMEPCAMCAGAMHWLGIRRVVYGCGAGRLAGLTKNRLRLSCREVFATSDLGIEVIGPLLEDEAFAVHTGFWNSRSGEQPGIYGM